MLEHVTTWNHVTIIFIEEHKGIAGHWTEYTSLQPNNYTVLFSTLKTQGVQKQYETWRIQFYNFRRYGHIARHGKIDSGDERRRAKAISHQYESKNEKYTVSKRKSSDGKVASSEALNCYSTWSTLEVVHPKMVTDPQNIWFTVEHQSMS